MSDFIKQLKEQINVADVVGEYVRLRKTGSNHMGLCPFHAERSPSFSVSEKKGIFHCFGCQKSGDAITFVQEIQGVSFHEAVRMLATKFGVKVPPEFAARGSSKSGGPSNEDKNEVYYKLNRFVAQFYHEKLMSADGKRAREYFARRGVTDATMKSAYLGYAPDQWSELYDFLLAKQAPLDKAEELGLIRRKEKTDNSGRAHYDLFRDRVMFPVTDSRGRVIAFGGRALGDGDGPKYLNSSESPVFKKGNGLYGLFYAQKEIRAEDLCVVVEGFMDCVSLQQAGIGYTVATLGTALTERQVAVIKRFTRNIVLLFDGDTAGKEAQARAMETFLNEDVVVRGVTLPDEFDPDEFVKERGAEALAALLRNAPFILDQRILELASQAGVHAEARARAVDQILPWIAKITSETAKMVRVQELSGLFDIKTDVLERRLSQLRNALPQGRAVAAGPAPKPGQQAARAVMPVKKIVINAKPSASGGLDALDVALLEFLAKYPTLLERVTDCEGLLNGLETEAVRGMVQYFIEQIKGGATSVSTDVLDRPECEASVALKNVLTRALMLGEEEQGKQRTPEQQEQLVQEIKDLERKLVRRGLERRRDSLRAIVLKADGSGQSTEFQRLMSEYSELAKRLDKGEVNL